MQREDSKQQQCDGEDKAHTATKCRDDDDTLCLYGGERCEAKKGEEWIVCRERQKWMHDKCTDSEPGQDNFVCNSCRYLLNSPLF
jgi:hypothetical protein